MQSIRTVRPINLVQSVYVLSVSQHEGRCRWLKDDKLLRELEGDSVDSEILDEELRSIELREPKT